MLSAIIEEPSRFAGFNDVAADVQSEVIRAAALQLLGKAPPVDTEVDSEEEEDDEVGGGVNEVTLKHLQDLLENFDGSVPLSVGAVVALGEVCSRFTSDQSKALEAIWSTKDKASYEAWRAIVDLGRRAATAEKGLERQKAAVKELKKFLEEHVGATGKQQAELDDVRRELQELVAHGAGAVAAVDVDEACARTVLEVLDPDAAAAGSGVDACRKARNAAVQMTDRLQTLETQLEELRAVEPDLRSRSQAVEQEAARIKAEAERVLAKQAEAQRVSVESAAANTVLETRKAALDAEVARLQAELGAREAQVREAAEAVAAREAALVRKGTEAQEALALRKEEAQRDVLAREAQAQAAAARARELEAKAQASEAQVQRAAKLEREIEAKAAAARSAAGATAALEAQVQEAAAALAAKEQRVQEVAAALALQKQRVQEVAEASARRVGEAEADVGRREEALRLQAKALGDHVGQLSRAVQDVEDKDAELKRERRECAEVKAALQKELQECAAATDAQTRALVEARAIATGQSGSLVTQLAAARQELREAEAAQVRDQQAVLAEARAQIESVEQTFQRELQEHAQTHAESERRLTAELEQVQQAQEAALQAHQKELTAFEEQRRAKYEALAASERQGAECTTRRTELEGRAATDSGCVSELRNLLKIDDADDTCSVTAKAKERIERLQRDLAGAQSEQQAALAAQAAAEAAKDTVVMAATEAAAQAKAYADEAAEVHAKALTEAATRAAAVAKAEANAASTTAAAAASANAARTLAQAKAEAQEANGKLELCVDQVLDLNRQLDVQTGRANEQSKRAVELEAREVAALERLNAEKTQLERRVAELEAQAQQVGTVLGCTGTTADRAAGPCDILELLGTTLSARDNGKAAHAAELERLRATHAAELESLGAVHRAERDRASVDNAAALVQAAHQHENSARAAAAEHAASVQAAAAENAASVQAAAAENAASAQAAAAEHAAELERTREAHVAEMQEKTREVADMYLKVDAAEQAVRESTTAQAALQAKLAERDKELAGAREQLEVTGRLRFAAHEQRKEMDRCVAELSALLLLHTGSGPGAPAAESVQEASSGDVCAAVRGAVAEIKRLRVSEARTAGLANDQDIATQRAKRAEEATRTLRAALGCAAADQDAAKCAARATGILALLRPPGTAVTAVADPVARARELVDLEAAVQHMLRGTPRADRTSLGAQLQAWAGTQTANLRAEYAQCEAKATEFVRKVAVALDMQRQEQVMPANVLVRLRERAEERKALVGALQKLAKAAGYTTSVGAVTNARVNDATVNEVVQLVDALIQRNSALAAVVLLAARFAGLVPLDDTKQWLVQGNGKDTLIRREGIPDTKVTLQQISDKLRRQVFAPVSR